MMVPAVVSKSTDASANGRCSASPWHTFLVRASCKACRLISIPITSLKPSAPNKLMCAPREQPTSNTLTSRATERNASRAAQVLVMP